jgi:hypothetical protein
LELVLKYAVEMAQSTIDRTYLAKLDRPFQKIIDIAAAIAISPAVDTANEVLMAH